MNPLSLNAIEYLPPGLQGLPSSKTFARVGVHGDGSCFFHSVCVAQNKHNYHTRSPEQQQRIGQAFRCEFARDYITPETWNTFVEENPQYSTPYNEIVENFCNSRYWANEHMIKFFSKMLDLNIVFIDAEKAEMYCGVHGNETKEPLIIILWVKKSHFEPVGLVHGADENRTDLQFMFDPVSDAAVVNDVMNRYKTQCSV